MSIQKHTILVVEDEVHLHEALKLNLELDSKSAFHGILVLFLTKISRYA